MGRMQTSPGSRGRQRDSWISTTAVLAIGKGHWLRDRAAAQDDPRPGQRGQAHGATNSRDDMQHHYTQGSGRRGERQEQLRVLEKLGHAVREALQRFGRPWYELPKAHADWDILLDA